MDSVILIIWKRFGWQTVKVLFWLKKLDILYIPRNMYIFDYTYCILLPFICLLKYFTSWHLIYGSVNVFVTTLHPETFKLIITNFVLSYISYMLIFKSMTNVMFQQKVLWFTISFVTNYTCFKLIISMRHIYGRKVSFLLSLEFYRHVWHKSNLLLIQWLLPCYDLDPNTVYY